jgi:hypothetical protein
MGEDGFMRSEAKMADVVDAATEAMRKKKKKKSREKFLKDCESMDEQARKEYMAQRAGELQKEPWATVSESVSSGRLRERSMSDPPVPNEGFH